MSSQQPTDSTSIKLPKAAITFGIGVVALLVSVYTWYQVAVVLKLETGSQFSQVSEISESVQDLSLRIESLALDIEKQASDYSIVKQETEKLLTDNENKFTLELQQFRSEFDTLAQSIEKIHQDLGRSVDTWALEEVEQLLLLAHQQLSLTGNIKLANRALSLADARLAEIGDPSLLSVRTHISKERSELAGLTQRDFSGTTIRIIAIQDQIEHFVLLDDTGSPGWPASGSLVNTKPEDISTIDEFGQAFLDDIKALIKFRKIDETQQPKLEPMQRVLVVESLRLKLDLAQQALYREDFQVFQRQLGHAKAWLERYFDPQHELVRQAQLELEQLLSLQFEIEFPDLSGSLQLLRENINERSAK